MKLRIIEGKSAGQEIPIAGRITIGREVDNVLSIADESASRYHAVIEADTGEACRLRDLQSRNGTLHNGTELSDATPIVPGDEIIIGTTVMRVLGDGSEAAETKPLPREGLVVEDSVAAKRVDLSEPDSRADGSRLRLLLRIGRRLAEPETENWRSEVLEAIRDGLPADRVAFFPLPDEPDRPAVGVPEAPAISTWVLRQVADTEQALCISNVEADDRLRDRDSIVRSGAKAILCAPVLARGCVFGVLYADRLERGEAYGRTDLELVAEIGRQMGAALLNERRLEDVRERARRLLAREHTSDGPVGRSDAFRNVLETARRAARSETPVLLLGETGTGKEVLARTIHDASNRSDGPFVPVNCAALPDGLILSELFGHEKGAFTGADRGKRGCFELAEGGTIFLDEIGEMPPDLQTKLLRVLETKTIQRVGGEGRISVDFRLVSATNRDIDADDTSFRRDLYYRIGVVTIRIPPLRERRADILPLAEHFLRILSGRRESPPAFSTDAEEALRAYRWPGNVRELRNVVERALVLGGGPVISANRLRLGETTEPPASTEAPISIAEAERDAIRRAMAHTGGTKTEAAEILGISRPTLNRKLKEYGLD